MSTDSTARKVIPIFTILMLLLDCVKIALFGWGSNILFFFFRLILVHCSALNEISIGREKRRESYYSNERQSSWLQFWKQLQGETIINKMQTLNCIWCGSLPARGAEATGAISGALLGLRDWSPTPFHSIYSWCRGLCWAVPLHELLCICSGTLGTCIRQFTIVYPVGA